MFIKTKMQRKWSEVSREVFLSGEGKESKRMILNVVNGTIASNRAKTAVKSR